MQMFKNRQAACNVEELDLLTIVNSLLRDLRFILGTRDYNMKITFKDTIDLDSL